MKQLSHAPGVHRHSLRRTAIAAVAALTASLGALTPAAAAQADNGHTHAVAMSKEHCQQGGWSAAGFASQGECVRGFVSHIRSGQGDVPQDCVGGAALRPNECPS